MSGEYDSIKGMARTLRMVLGGGTRERKVSCWTEFSGESFVECLVEDSLVLKYVFYAHAYELHTFRLVRTSTLMYFSTNKPFHL